MKVLTRGVGQYVSAIARFCIPFWAEVQAPWFKERKYQNGDHARISYVSYDISVQKSLTIMIGEDITWSCIKGNHKEKLWFFCGSSWATVG